MMVEAVAGFTGFNVAYLDYTFSAIWGQQAPFSRPGYASACICAGFHRHSVFETRYTCQISEGRRVVGQMTLAMDD